MERQITICGIDPGINGAISFFVIKNNKKTCKVFDMPKINVGKKKTKHELDIQQIVHLLAMYDPEYCCIEEPKIAIRMVEGKAVVGQSMQSVATNWKNYGILLGILSTLMIPFEEISPRKWQKEFFKRMEKDDPKKMAYMVASKLFPDIELTGARGGIKDGRSDALLICEYAKRQLIGKE